jgi:predicted RecA/RadA family phage recombinase
MGLSNRFPGQIVPMETESAVRDGDLVVVGSADNKCAFPGGASPTTGLLGVVMLPDGSVAAVGDTVDVLLSGIYPVRSGGVITRGDQITSNGVDGTAKTETAGAGVNVGVIGQALESGASGERVSTNINPFIKQGA